MINKNDIAVLVKDSKELISVVNVGAVLVLKAEGNLHKGYSDFNQHLDYVKRQVKAEIFNHVYGDIIEELRKLRERIYPKLQPEEEAVLIDLITKMSGL